MSIWQNLAQPSKSFFKWFWLLLVFFVYLTGYYSLSILWILAGIALLMLWEWYNQDNSDNDYDFQIVQTIERTEKTCTQQHEESQHIGLPSSVELPHTGYAEWLDKSPGIHDIKVSDENITQNGLIIDFDIIYQGDWNITISINGIQAGIKDLQLNATARIILHPVTEISIVGGYKFFLLNKPEIDFHLTKTAAALNFIGLDSFRNYLKEQACTQIAAYAVLPNCLAWRLSNTLPAKMLYFNKPAGVLRIHIIEAQNLMQTDSNILGDHSDAYVIISVGAREFRTETVNNTLNPKWDFDCEVIVDQLLGQFINITVYDEDSAKFDDFLGRLKIDIQQVASLKFVNEWFLLDHATSGKIHLNHTWMDLSSNAQDFQADQDFSALKHKGQSTALLLVYVEKAEELFREELENDVEQSLFVQLKLGNQLKMTSCQHPYFPSNPVWEEGFIFHVLNAGEQKLYASVLDTKNDLKLGTLVYSLSQLLEARTLELYSAFDLQSSTNASSKLCVHLQLRILKSGAEESITTENNELNKSSPAVNNSGHTANSLTSQDHHTVAVLKHRKKPSIGSISCTLQNITNDFLPANKFRKHSRTSQSSSLQRIGQIQLTLRYSQQRSCLIILVHKMIMTAKHETKSQLNPYIKIYLGPGNVRDCKRKTKVVESYRNPIYDEIFEYVMSQNDLKGCQLLVTVNKFSSSFYRRNKTIAQVLIDLAGQDLKNAKTEWYNLTS